MPDGLKAWAQKSFETFARKKVRNDEPGDWENEDRHVYHMINDDEPREGSLCRVDHGWDGWWAGAPDRPGPEWIIYEDKIEDEANKLGWEIMEHAWIGGEYDSAF